MATTTKKKSTGRFTAASKPDDLARLVGIKDDIARLDKEREALLVERAKVWHRRRKVGDTMMVELAESSGVSAGLIPNTLKKL